MMQTTSKILHLEAGVWNRPSNEWDVSAACSMM